MSLLVWSVFHLTYLAKLSDLTKQINLTPLSVFLFRPYSGTLD